MSKINKNIIHNLSLIQSEESLDIAIVVTNNKGQAEYWRQRLERTKEHVCGKHCYISVVYEDWPKGAGNALGTLYAVRKAYEDIKERYHCDLFKALKRGSTVALYHTAGKGSRLYPLTGSENINKSAVKLPSLLECNGEHVPITLLEAVIKQSKVYSLKRPARLSVFWGDQIFIPTEAFSYGPLPDIEILMKKIPAPPSAELWEENNLQQYGLLLFDSDGSARQVEKISYSTFCRMQAQSLGSSIGSFSLSIDMLQCLLEEFSSEIENKEGFLNTDLDLWMPLTLDEETFSEILETKGISFSEKRKQYLRMQTVKNFMTPESLFNAADIGHDCYWWDFGNIKSYYKNILKLTQDTTEGRVLRHFFNINEKEFDSENGVVSLACDITNAEAKNSVLLRCKCGSIHTQESILINVSAPKVEGNTNLIYNVTTEEELFFNKNDVCTEILHKDKKLRFQTDINRHGGDDWHLRLNTNPLSYGELHEYSLNQKAPSNL